MVTLAAALALPEDVPFRDLLTLIAFFVVVASILLNGSTLPWLVHRLKLKPPDAAEDDALQEAALLDEARKAGLQRLDEASVDGDPDEVLARLKIRADERSNAAWERLGRATGAETPIETYQRLRLEMLLAERTAVLAARDDGRAHDDAVRNVIRQLDVEEAMLDRVVDGQVDSARELVAPEGVAQTCEHLAAFANLPEFAPVTPACAKGASPRERRGFIFGCVWRAERWGVVTLRLPVTPNGTSTKPATQRCAAWSQARPGVGATSMRCWANSPRLRRWLYAGLFRFGNRQQWVTWIIPFASDNITSTPCSFALWTNAWASAFVMSRVLVKIMIGPRPFTSPKNGTHERIVNR